MIEFVCPGCTKSYEANRAFIGFETRCLRCGTLLLIPKKSGSAPPKVAAAAEAMHQKSGSNGANGHSSTLAAPKRAANPKPPKRNESVSSDIDFGPDLSVAAAVATATPAVTAPPRRRPILAEVASAEPPMPIPQMTEPKAAISQQQSDARKKRKKQYIIGGSVSAVALVVVLMIAFSGGKPKKAPEKPAPPPPREEAKVEPPPPPAKLPKVYEPAPMPRGVRPAVEAELTLAELLLEYGEGPPACDQKYAGKDLLIRGIYQGYKLGTVTVVPADEKSQPVSFKLLPPADPTELTLGPPMQPGQPVAIRGTYRAGCRFNDGTIEPVEMRADTFYLNRSLVLEGAVIRSVNAPTGPVPFPTLVLEPPFTDSRLMVTCYFKTSELENVMKLKAGAKIDLLGRCGGRRFNAVRLDNCAILTTSDEPPGPDSIRIPTEALFTAYEAELLPFTRPNLKDPSIEILPVTAEGLGHAFQLNSQAANFTYRNKPVQLSGVVKERHANLHMIVLQCGTETVYSVAVFFSASNYAKVPPDKTLVLRGVCSGLSAGYVRVDSGDYTELETGARALRTDVDFLPYRLGKIHTVDMILPARAKTSPLRRMEVRFAGDDMIQVAVTRTGVIPGTTLLKEPAPTPTWSHYPPAKQLPQARRYRIVDGTVEIGQPFVNGPKNEVQDFWEPVLKAGLKRGQSWSAKFPDGKIATYTVMGFSKHASGADQLEIKRTLRDLGDPGNWEEAGVTYVRGLGEVRRIVVGRNERGEATVHTEFVLVADGSPKETELKKDK